MKKRRKADGHHILAKITSILVPMLWPTISFSQTTCSVALVLALDVSGSVDWKEFRLQRSGIESAFRDPEVTELIELLPGGISASVTYWSGATGQRLAVGWKHIKNTADAAVFADKIISDKRARTGALTAIGNALLHAEEVLSANPIPCHRQVIDVSGDGRSNRGIDPSFVADALAAKGITTNALVIVNKYGTLVPYFQKNIVRGVGSFVQPAYGYQDYARAIKQKILRELVPTSAKHQFNGPKRKRLAQNQPQD